MNNEFITSQLAKALKGLGFDEKCFGYFYEKCTFFDTNIKNSELDEEDSIAAPLWQQAFEWFREEHNLLSWVYTSDGITYYFAILSEGRYLNTGTAFDSYPAAQEACLKRLIEKVNDNTR